LIELVAGQNTAINADNAYKLQLAIGDWSWGVIVNKASLQPAFFSDEQGVSMQADHLLLNYHDIDPSIEKLIVYIARDVGVSSDNLSASFNALINNDGIASIDISSQISDQTALNLLEIYKHKDNWKIRCVLQGYSAGLPKLLASYGLKLPRAEHQQLAKVDNTDSLNTVDINKPTGQRQSAAKIDSISAQSTASIELRWQSPDAGKKSISNYFLGDKFAPISDLRIGCFYELNNAQNGIVYSFEQEFKGSFDGVPYIAASRSNDIHLERLDINTRYQHKLNRYLVFVTMMEAFDNWNGLNVEVAFDIEGLDNLVISPDTLMVKPIFAVAMIDYSQTEPKITPLNEYFNDLVELDSAFGWGLPFRSADPDQHCENNRDNDED
jgi:uncharacterized protein involved in tellurium resistance